MKIFYFTLFTLLINFQTTYCQQNVTITGMIEHCIAKELKIGNNKTAIDRVTFSSKDVLIEPLEYIKYQR